MCTVPWLVDQVKGCHKDNSSCSVHITGTLRVGLELLLNTVVLSLVAPNFELHFQIGGISPAVYNVTGALHCIAGNFQG